MKTQKEIIAHNKRIDTEVKYCNIIITIISGILLLLWIVYPPIARNIFKFSSSIVEGHVIIFTLLCIPLLIIFQLYRDNLQESYLVKIDKEMQLKEFYANYLKPKLNPLEKQRKNIVLNIFYIAIGLLATSIILSMLLAPYVKNGDNPLPFFLSNPSCYQ